MSVTVDEKIIELHQFLADPGYRNKPGEYLEFRKWFLDHNKDLSKPIIDRQKATNAFTILKYAMNGCSGIPKKG